MRTTAPRMLVIALGALILGSCSANHTSADPSYPTPSTAAGAPPPAGIVRVTLDLATDNAVTVDVVDESGLLLGATSGTPGDGASVEPYKVAVENGDPSTLRLTWVGGPCDGRLSLSIDMTGRRFRLVQPECAGDSVVHDRILLARFSRPIAAIDVEAILQVGADTSAR